MPHGCANGTQSEWRSTAFHSEFRGREAYILGCTDWIIVLSVHAGVGYNDDRRW